MYEIDFSKVDIQKLLLASSEDWKYNYISPEEYRTKCIIYGDLNVTF